jgi:predicted hotdog family 3-hydroxylacyl-ACP dehydratase
MCLLDQVVGWDRGVIACTAVSHRDPDNPLRRDGHLAAVHAIEYAGQACALHGALVGADPDGDPAAAAEGLAGRPLLAAVSQVELAPGPLDQLPSPLRICAWRELGGRSGAIYRFAVESDGRKVAQGRLTVLVSRGLAG